MFGREALKPLDLQLPLQPGPSSASVGAHADKLHQELAKVYEAARKRSANEAIKRKKAYDLGVKIVKFAEGQRVLLRREPGRPGLFRKWVRRFEGPFVICRQLSDVNFIIRREPSGREQIAHVDRLRCWKTGPTPAATVDSTTSAMLNDESIDLTQDPLRRSVRQRKRKAT